MFPSSHEIILTSSPDGSITAYDSISGTILACFTGSRSPRHGLTLASKSYIAASHFSSSASASGSIHLYNWWSPIAFHHLPVPGPVAPLRTTPDGSYIFAGRLSGHIHCVSVPSGQVLSTVRAHDKPVSCFAISNGGSILISGGDDGAISAFPIFLLVDSSGEIEDSRDLLLRSFIAHEGPVTSITSCTGISECTIVSCSIDCTCKLWSALEGTNLKTLIFPCGISALTLDPTETTFYAAGYDGFIYRGIWRFRSKQEANRHHKPSPLAEKHGGGVVSVATANRGKNLVSAAEDGRVYIWDIDAEEVTMVLGNAMGSISDLVVASPVDQNSKEYGFRVAKEGTQCNSSSDGLYRSRLVMKDTTEMESALSEARKDRGKAIEMLESAIDVHERLLELILKEAKGSPSSKLCN